MENTFPLVSLIVSIFSVVLAVVAIWIALYGKQETDKTNQRTQDLLTEIKSDAKSVVQYAMPELQKFGDSVREFAFRQGGGDPDALPAGVEKALRESTESIQAELDKIRGEKDISAMKRKVDDLEKQIRVSQETVKKSVRESTRVMTVIGPSGDVLASRIDRLGGLVQAMAQNEGLRVADYGRVWFLRLRRTGGRLRGAGEIPAQISDLTSHLSESERAFVFAEGLEFVVPTKKGSFRGKGGVGIP